LEWVAAKAAKAWENASGFTFTRESLGHIPCVAFVGVVLLLQTSSLQRWSAFKGKAKAPRPNTAATLNCRSTTELDGAQTASACSRA
jgi:hypothetical protein